MTMQEAFEVPPSPEGYYLAYTLRYPKIFSYLTTPLYLLTCFIFYIIWNSIRYNFFPKMAGPNVFWVAVLTLPIANIVHALIQRCMGGLFGYKVSFNITHNRFRPETYITEPGQFQCRDHALLIAITPLSIFVLLLIFLVTELQGDIGDMLAFFLLVSIARTVEDIYFVWRLLRMPKGTLLYNINSKEKIIFKPRP